MDLPSRTRTRIFLPHRSSSLRPIGTTEKGPSLRRSTKRSVAKIACCFSYGQRGRVSSGVSISATRIFTPSSQIVSPSTTQVTRTLPHRANLALTFSQAEFTCSSARGGLTSRDGEFALGSTSAASSSNLSKGDSVSGCEQPPTSRTKPETGRRKRCATLFNASLSTGPTRIFPTPANRLREGQGKRTDQL